jgi:hypothetical protein
LFDLDPVDQHNGVIDNNARQRDDTQEGDKAEIGLGDQQPDDHPY